MEVKKPSNRLYNFLRPPSRLREGGSGREGLLKASCKTTEKNALPPSIPPPEDGRGDVL